MNPPTAASAPATLAKLLLSTGAQTAGSAAAGTGKGRDMRIEFTGGGYRGAAAAFRLGNDTVSLLHDSLWESLLGYAGMAGDDATSADFAAAYDVAAQDALDTLHDVVDAYAALARLTATSAANHTRANAASVLPRSGVGGQPAEKVSWNRPTPTDDDPTTATVATLVVPSSLGHDYATGLPDEVTWILDQVEGFLWPNADVATLRAAASTWSSAAASLDHLQHHCETGAAALRRQSSPEIALATGATGRLHGVIGDLATACRAIGSACGEYAAHVETQRHEIIDLVLDLLREAVLVQGIGLVLGPFTAGASAGGAAALNAGRIALLGPKVMAVLARLKVLVGAVVAVVGQVARSLDSARDSLAGFHEAESALAAVRPQASTVTGKVRARVPGGGLRAHEAAGGHTLSKHVGKTDAELLDRFKSEPWLPRNSSFTTEATAERAIGQLLTSHDAEITAWLTSGDTRLELDGDAQTTIGRVALKKTGTVHDTDLLRVVLVPDESMSTGFRVLTAFPRP